MTLWLSGLVLVVGSILSSSALTEEECRVLVTPQTTFKPMYGKWNFILGYTDNVVYNDMFKSAKSQWIEFKQTEDPKVMIEEIGIRHPTYCKYAASAVTIVENSGISQKSNFTCTFHSLDTCDDCLLYYVSSINNNNLIQITDPTTKEELKTYKGFYLMSKGTTISEDDLAHAKKQAECLGFKGEPPFHYDPKNIFCNKDNDD